MNIKGTNRRRLPRAFTLIEMLTVITIMGIVAALVVTMGQAAAQRKKIVAVQGMQSRLETLIENYKLKLNYYPPDNGALVSNTFGPGLLNYDGLAATNPLIYELTGGTNLVNLNGASGLAVFNSSASAPTLAITGSDSYSGVFNRAGIANGDPLEPHNFFQPGPTPKEVSPYDAVAAPRILGLVVPADLARTGASTLTTNNFWHYDSSTTNRHNMTSYDLWAEYSIGTKNGQLIIKTNGNFVGNN